MAKQTYTAILSLQTQFYFSVIIHQTNYFILVHHYKKTDKRLKDKIKKWLHNCPVGGDMH